MGEGQGALTVASFTSLIKMETGGELTATQTKQVLAALIEGKGSDPAKIAADMGFEAMDSSELEDLVDKIISDSPDEWARFCEGDAAARGKLQGFFVGQIMKATKGQADGKEVNRLLSEKAN